MTKIKSAVKVTILISLIIFTLPASAFYPVIDVTAIAQLIKQVDQLKQQYDNAVQQLQQQQEIVKDAEGNYGWGTQLDSAADVANRQWTPDTWDDALQGLSGGNPERYQQLLQEYQKNVPTLSQDDFAKGSSASNALNYIQNVQTNQAATVSASYAFNDLNTHIQNVHQLTSMIEQTTDAKAATDLNSRLISEVAYLSTEQLKMQALLNQQLARNSASEILQTTDAAKFNTVPDQQP